MQRLRREKHTPYFVPDYIARSVADIDFDALKKQGVRFIAFDADSTLMEYRGKVISPETVKFLQEVRMKFEDWCIASNRVIDDLDEAAASIDAALIRARGYNRKPQKRFFQRVIEHFEAKPEEIAMIGDKLVADMYGGKRSGLVTVWVQRMGERDSIWDQALHIRDWERRMMQKHLRNYDAGNG